MTDQAKSCRMCGATENLTKHHLLKRRGAWRAREHGLTNRKIRLCRACHKRFHSGPGEARQAAWDELMPLLTDEERRVRELPRPLEQWEQILLAGSHD